MQSLREKLTAVNFLSVAMGQGVRYPAAQRSLKEIFMHWINRLLGKKEEPPRFEVPLMPEQSISIIGDIHGRDDLLSRMVELLDKEQLDHWVFVGDYVDRGPTSAEVLTRLMTPEGAGGQVICLMGNHEKMMLDFLDHPIERGRRWLRNGGDRTMESFGVLDATEKSSDDQLHAAP